jgi:distribution and morphology protein 34
MTLRLSKLHLRAILILVVSASKGITLVFKNDPLQNVDVSSTFDSVEVIRGYLQQEIEGQLREMFREDLPGIIHRLSQRWFTGTGAQGEVKLPYVDQSAGLPEEDIFPPPPQPGVSPLNLTPRRKALAKVARERRLSISASESPTSYTVFPDIEDYDPTYGLRPEGLPTHSGYEAFGRLWEKAREGEGRGLGGLMASTVMSPEEDRGDVSDESEEEYASSDIFDTQSMLRQMPIISPPSSRYQEDAVEWETYPAVGGGLITRPRVFHSQSQIRAPSEAGGSIAIPSPSGTGGSITARANSVSGRTSTVGVSGHCQIVDLR